MNGVTQQGNRHPGNWSGLEKSVLCKDAGVLDMAVMKAVTESGTSQPSAPILGQPDCIPGTHQDWEPSYRGLQL